jgi:hypothetical protein
MNTSLIQQQDSQSVPAVELSGIRRLWYGLRLAVQDMNYASRRVIELQAPWINR